MRGGALIAWPYVGPRPAPLLAFACCFAAFARIIRLNVERLVVATDSINAEFNLVRARRMHSGTLNAGNAAVAFNSRRDAALQPTGRLCALRRRVGKGPCAATRLAFASRGAHGGIAGFDDEMAIVAPRPINPHVGARNEYALAQRQNEARQRAPQADPIQAHPGKTPDPLHEG